MTADDDVTIPRELAERAWKIADASGLVHDTTAQELSAILNPPPEFDVGMVEVMAANSWERYGEGRWHDGHYPQPKTNWRKNIVSALTAARSAGWEMVRAEELEALREFTALLFDGEEPELTDDELAYGIYFSDHLTDAQFYAPLSSAQRDAIRKAKAAQR